MLHGFAFTMVVGIITGTYSTRVHRRGDRQLLARRRADARGGARAGAGGDRAAAAGPAIEAAAEGASVVGFHSRLQAPSPCRAVESRTLRAEPHAAHSFKPRFSASSRG